MYLLARLGENPALIFRPALSNSTKISWYQFVRMALFRQGCGKVIWAQKMPSTAEVLI
jgi:hypothetical protein